MGTFGQNVSNAAIGLTADSFDSIGTITVSEKARGVHGFLVSYAENARTAAEACHAQIRWSSADNNIGNQIISLPGTSGGAPATNVQSMGRPQLLIPLGLDINPNTKFDFELAAHLPDATDGWDIALAILYNDGDLGELTRWWPNMIPMRGSDAEAAAAVTATTETALTALEIPGWANEITGFQLNIAPDAEITAEDPIVPKVTFRSTIIDFDPQEFVGPSLSSILGTAVGNAHEVIGMFIPASIQVKSPANQTVTPFVSFTTTSATNIAVSADVFFRI